MWLRVHDALTGFIDPGLDDQAVRAIITIIKVIFFADQQIRMPVQAAEYREIPEGRGDVFVQSVFQENLNGP